MVDTVLAELDLTTALTGVSDLAGISGELVVDTASSSAQPGRPAVSTRTAPGL